MDGDNAFLEKDNLDNIQPDPLEPQLTDTGIAKEIKSLEPQQIMEKLHANTYLRSIISGPFILGYSLKKLDFSSITLNLVAGSAINIFLSGSFINYIVKKAMVDHFGFIVSGFSQLMGGVVFETS